MIIGSEIIYFDSLPSTNTHALQILKNKKPCEGTILRAGFQSGGRGQTGNKWESEAGKNLLISIILYPESINPSDQFMISMAISLGICDLLDKYIPGSKIKWPNDIYVNNDKIAGILIESSIMGNSIENCIAGIGLNVNQSHFLSNAPNPVSLCQIAGKEYDLTDILNDLSSSLDLRYKMIIAEDYKQVREQYIAKLFRLNEWASYRAHNQVFTGRLLSVTESGRLQIETKPGSKKEYFFKEIEFIL